MASAQKIAVSLQTGFVFNTSLSDKTDNLPFNKGLSAAIRTTYLLPQKWEVGLFFEGNAYEYVAPGHWTAGIVAHKKIGLKKSNLYAGTMIGYNFRNSQYEKGAFEYYGVSGVTLDIHGGVFIYLTKRLSLNTSISARYVYIAGHYHGWFENRILTFPVMVGVRYAF